MLLWVSSRMELILLSGLCLKEWLARAASLKIKYAERRVIDLSDTFSGKLIGYETSILTVVGDFLSVSWHLGNEQYKVLEKSEK